MKMFSNVIIFLVAVVIHTSRTNTAAEKYDDEDCPSCNKRYDYKNMPYSSRSTATMNREDIGEDSFENSHLRSSNTHKFTEDYYDDEEALEFSNQREFDSRNNSRNMNTKNYIMQRPNEKESDISEYFLKAYFPELNDFYHGPQIGPQEYHITIQPNIKDIRNKLAKKIQQTTADFTHAVKTIRTMLNEETVEAVSSLITLPSTEFQFIKNVIKILKVTMDNVVKCVSTAGNRLMALPRRWSSASQPCAVKEFKESWGIVENVHHIFQNAIYYIKNFIIKLETCFTHEESLIQWCIYDIFNDVPSYVYGTVSKLNKELDSGIIYLKAVPERAEKCQMTSDAEKKLLLPFMIIREMVKCVLSKTEF